MRNVTYINASAGSGKTYTLIEKLADLIINHGVKPEQVILTTFTVKAANEFKEKAKAKLYEQGRYEDATRLDQALIGTVHSVCQQMIGRYWFHLGLAPSMGVMAEEDSVYYISQSMADLPTEQELEQLHEFCRNFNISKYKDGRTIGLDYNFWQAQLKQIISLATNYELDGFGESENRSLDFIRQFNKGVSVSVSDEEFERMYAEAKSYVDQSNRIKKKDEYYEKFYDARRSKNDKNTTWFTKLQRHFQPKYGPTCETVLSRLEDMWNSKEVYYRQEQYIHLMFNLAKRWQDNFTQFKREKNLLDYNDMEKYMLQLLNNKDVASEIRRSYRYLFVDEFQDSSPIQVKIFDALSELMEHSYWVGDSKQAIYGFRGSDIEMVEAVVGNVTETNGCDTYSLDTCWRSLPDIIDVNNEVFTQTFKDILSHDKIYLKHKRKNDEGIQSLRYITTDETKDIADHIACMVKDGIALNDIAVLARTNSVLTNLAYDLKEKYGIPTNRGNMPIIGTRTCALVESLLRIANSDKDLLSKVQVAILTEEDLSTRQVIEKKLLFDSHDGNKTAYFLSDISLVKRLTDIRPMLQQQSVAAAVETLIIELGLFDMVKRIEEDPESGASCLQTIINTAKTYEEHSVQMKTPATIDGFIAYLESVEPTVAGNPDGIQLHTFHSSKGLQWKYVILTSLDTDTTNGNNVIKNDIYGVHPARDDRPTPQNPYPDMHIRLTPWIYGKNIPDRIMDKISGQEIYDETIRAAKEEANRLLYVGMTRPKDVLILDVKKKKKNTETLKWFKCVGFGNIPANTSNETPGCDLLGTGLEFADHTLTDNTLNGLACYKYGNKNETARMLKPRHPQNPGNPPLRYVSPSRVDKKGEVAAVHDFGSRIRFSSQPSDMAVVGDCIHHIFACCNEINPADTYKVKNLVSAYGLTGVLSQHGQINEAWNNLTLYLSKAHGQALKIYHERPFRMESGGQTVVGSMDLVWQTAEGDILVDFKTCPMGTEAILDKNSDNYAGRHAGQLDAYEDALVSAGENVVARYIYYPVSGLIVSITHGKQLLPTQ